MITICGLYIRHYLYTRSEERLRDLVDESNRLSNIAKENDLNPDLLEKLQFLHNELTYYKCFGLPPYETPIGEKNEKDRNEAIEELNSQIDRLSSESSRQQYSQSGKNIFLVLLYIYIYIYI